MRVRLYVDMEARTVKSPFGENQKWLEKSGIYLEIVPIGVYNSALEFNLIGDANSLDIKRYSWNRFFVNLYDSGEMRLEVKLGGSNFLTWSYRFNIFRSRVFLIFGNYLLLRRWTIREIRRFAVKLMKIGIGWTRFSLLSDEGYKYFYQEGNPTSYFKTLDLVCSIFTERGIKVIVNPFCKNFSFSQYPQFFTRFSDFCSDFKKFAPVIDVSNLSVDVAMEAVQKVKKQFPLLQFCLPEGAKSGIGADFYVVKCLNDSEEVTGSAPFVIRYMGKLSSPSEFEEWLVKRMRELECGIEVETTAKHEASVHYSYAWAMKRAYERVFGDE